LEPDASHLDDHGIHLGARDYAVPSPREQFPLIRGPKRDKRAILRRWGSRCRLIGGELMEWWCFTGTCQASDIIEGAQSFWTSNNSSKLQPCPSTHGAGAISGRCRPNWKRKGRRHLLGDYGACDGIGARDIHKTDGCRLTVSRCVESPSRPPPPRCDVIGGTRLTSRRKAGCAFGTCLVVWEATRAVALLTTT
jgi:hypothetical protein